MARDSTEAPSAQRARETGSARSESLRPVLASEALKEDLAPLRPGARTGRFVLCGAGTALILVGAATRLGMGAATAGTNAASLAFSAGGAAVAVGLLPFPYALRAWIGLSLGLALVLIGFQGIGPLAALLSAAPLSELDRLAALALLPAALMFRAKYRAYRPARWVLIGALLVATPFGIGAGADVANSSLPWVVRTGAACELVALACALFGFMGTDTTGGGSVWASLLLAVGTANIALRDVHANWAGDCTHCVAAVSAISVLIPITFGLYQILAWALARDARRALLKRDVTGPSPA